MKLQYVGKFSPIHLSKIPNPAGGMGILVRSGEEFECDPQVGADLLKYYESANPVFVECEGERRRGPGRPPKAVEIENKMQDVSRIK